ncbi:hypothetical protein RHS01_08546 [Rhizoctonia solani]|uniref:CCHC-type domain-containing protein n=1 Tax=Rhizoctonia solani TaxID=456999 RepID=A0A8H7I5W7_9AGAM|nr:hypothetical protein RHS01_08546 [Rhizoctonia solani]
MQGDRQPAWQQGPGKNPSPAWPLTGPITPPTQTGGEAHSPAQLGLGSRPLSAFKGTGYDSEAGSQLPPPFDSGSSVKQPKMDLPDPYKGNTRGCKATQWLDRMLLWVALHRDQFNNKEEADVVWILYHMTDKAANWALPLIGAIIKGEGNPPSTIPDLTAKFKEAFTSPNAKRAAARKIATLTQTTTTSDLRAVFHWKVKELLSTKDNIPNNDLEAIFAALVKIDNTCWENKENRPKKVPAKPLATVATSTTTTRVRLSKDPNYITPEERDRCRASGLCVKCGQKGHGIKQCPNGWKATIKEAAKIGEVVESEKE